MSLFSRLFVQKKDLMQNSKHLKMISKLKSPTMRRDHRYVDCMFDNSTAVAIDFEATCTLCSDMINGHCSGYYVNHYNIVQPNCHESWFLTYRTVRAQNKPFFNLFPLNFKILL